MPAPYTATLYQGSNDVTYGGKTYKAGDKYPATDACDMLRFLNAFAEANPNGSLTEEEKGVVEKLMSGCPTTPNEVTPQQAPVTPPVEVAPDPNAGDTAQQQAAPEPPLAAGVSETPADIPPPAPTEEPTRPEEGLEHPTLNSEQAAEQTNAGDPVDIFSGAFYLEETDLVIPNTLIPLSFTRVYRSGAPSFGPFGWNWDHNLNVFLRELTSGNIALWRNLHEETFIFTGTSFDPPRGVFEKMERLAGPVPVYEIGGDGGIVMRFERPAGWIDTERIPLVSIKDRHGNQLRFTYGAEDKLVEVKDDTDSFFKFTYDDCGLLVTTTDGAGRQFTYDHDEQTMQLIRVVSPPIQDFPKGITRNYHYEDPWTPPELRHNIVRIEDDQGNVYVENLYEADPASWSFARVTEQLYGGYLFQFRYTPLQWVPDNALFINIQSLRVEVMNPDYGLETYTFNYRGDLLDRRYRLNKDGSFRVVVWQYEFDEQGNPAKITRPDGSEEISIFDSGNPDPRMRGKLLQRELTSAAGFPAPSRIVWRGSYENTYQLLVEEKNESSAATTYKYDFNLTPGASGNTGKLKEVIQPAATLPDGTVQNAKTSFEHNSKGQVTRTVLPDSTVNEFTYGSAGNEKNRLIRQVFDVATVAAERKIKYNAAGFNTEMTDAMGGVTKQVFNALGLMERAVFAAVSGVTAEQILHYDEGRQMTLAEMPKGNYADGVFSGSHIHDRYEKDVLGFTTKAVLGSNTANPWTVQLVNDYRGNVIQMTHPDGSRLRRKIDERGLTIKEEVIGTDGQRITSSKVYDRSGKVTQETNPFGLTTKYVYDGFSRILRVQFANGTELRNTWLANDLLESEETFGDDGTGTARQLSFKSYTYDEKGRKKTETIKNFTTDPAVFINITTTFFYDSSDRVVKIVGPRGNITTRQYDGMGRMVMERDAMGNEEHTTYDGNNNITRTDNHHREPDGTTSIITKTYQFDARNRQIKVTEPDGATITTEYDDRNLLVRQTDYRNRVKELRYDAFRNKISQTEDVGGLNILQQWTMDNMLRMNTYTDPTGQISTYTYDTVGRNFKITYANGFSSTKFYNGFNQIIREQLASGAEFQYTYDAGNRITKIINPVFPAPLHQVPEHEFKYDGMDRVLQANAGGSNILRTYDSQGRLTSEGAWGHVLSCAYNDMTGEVEKTWPDGRKEKLLHDLNGVIQNVEQIANGSVGSGNNMLATFRCSGPQAFGQADYLGNIRVKNIYDERKRLTDVTMQSPAGMNETISYRYDVANMRQVEAFSGQNPKNSFFEFDNKYRLTHSKDGFTSPIVAALTQAQHDSAIDTIRTAATAAAHNEQFDYNTADARTKYTETGNPDVNYTFLPGHKIQTDGTDVFTYSADGTETSEGTMTYESDTLGRTVVIRSGGSTITEIVFDAFGRPGVLKEAGKPDRTFNYLGGFVEQENAGGTINRQITLHPVTGIPIAYHSAGATHYTLFDNRYNLVGLADTAGNLLETYRYRSFGLPVIYNSSAAAVPQSAFGMEPVFGGQRFLAAPGLYLSKKRLMNPVHGVYLSPDPKGYMDSPTLYAYAAQDPVNQMDPNGEIIPLIVAAFVIGGALAGAGYSAYDAYHNPSKYEGWQGSLRILGNVFGGAAIGGVAVVGGELVLAAGGVGAFATGTSAVTLTAAQTFVLYGTAATVTGAVLRHGFNEMFPEYVDPVSAETMATDYVLGGGIPVVGSVLRPLAAPVINGARQIIGRAVGGNWRFFGNTIKMIRNNRIKYTLKNLIWDPRSFENVSKQYWRVSRGADGKALHHLWVQNQSRWMPQGFRNAGLNMLEIPGALNTWMGGRLAREWVFRAAIAGILAGTATGSYTATEAFTDWLGEEDPGASEVAEATTPTHPNDKPPVAR